MHKLRWMLVLGLAVCLTPLPGARAQSQQPVQPVSPSAPMAPNAPSPGTSSTKHGKTKYSHANDFLILGTVFNDKALSFPGVQLRVRLAGEKKYRWDTFTNSRGEFAVRVPRGAQYEVTIHAKGFLDQTKTVDSNIGDTQERLSVQMQAATKEKK